MKTAVRRLSSTWRSKVRDGNQREKNVSQTGCLPFLCVRVCGCVCSTPKDYSSVRDQQTGSALHRRGNPAPLRHLVHVSRFSQVNKRKKTQSESTLHLQKRTTIYEKKNIRQLPFIRTCTVTSAVRLLQVQQLDGQLEEPISSLRGQRRAAERHSEGRTHAGTVTPCLISPGKPAQISEPRLFTCAGAQCVESPQLHLPVSCSLRN